jgi:hypothetical protein
MTSAWEQKNIAAVKELLDGVSDAEVHALCVQALRTWLGKRPSEGQFAMHGELGREVIPLLVAHRNRPPADPESVNHWKEPFISEQMQPWFASVTDFLSWFIRAGFGDPVSWDKQNVITVRLTQLGIRFLQATEEHPLLPRFVDRVHARCPGLPSEVTALLVDAQACMERMLLRPAIVLMGVAYEMAIEAVADVLVTKSFLAASVLDQNAARRIASIRGVVDTVLPGATAQERDDRFAVARAYQFADDLRRRRNDASHTTPRYGFDDLSEAQEFLVSAGRQLPLIWSLTR